MAVLIEAISVVVRVDVLERSYPGGWKGYRDAAPNATFCCDPELSRVGFMRPDEVERHVASLAGRGLMYRLGGNGPAVDLVVVDQRLGPMVACDWIEFGHIAAGPKGEPVAACRLVGSKIPILMSPVGWTYDHSLSQSFKFVKSEVVDRRMAYLGDINGVARWVERNTGSDVYSSLSSDEG